METRITGISGVQETPNRGVATPSPVQTTPATTTPLVASSPCLSNVAAAGCVTSGSMSQNSAASLIGLATTSTTNANQQQSANNNNNAPPPPRILSRNVNGTLVQTSVPQNEAELQLYRVMQRASLLGYYDTLLEMGGDDVQQLCDAGEEEFLEIMALVGMASKPLHVRRLQKALQEWITNPSLFQTPVVPSTSTPSSTSIATATGFTGPPPSARSQSTASSFFSQNSMNVTGVPTAIPFSHVSSNTTAVPAVASVTATSTSFRHSPSPNMSYSTSHSPVGVLQVGTCESSCGSGTTPSPSAGGAPASPTQPTPSLLASQVERLAEAAERLAATIRPLDPKPHNVKKKICKNLEMVMAIPEGDPRRMEELRKYAAIYGRFDCKRKPEKALTLHEVSVNEAAAQICRFVPALLTRRDELFPLARRVVRDSGYHYSKSQYLSMSRSRENGDDSESERTKRAHLADPGEDPSQAELDLRCSNSLNSRRQGSLSPVWQKKSNNGIFRTSIEEISDSDSQFSFSNDESMSIHDMHEGEPDNVDKEGDFNLKVIASRGDDIIAVANPALMECSHPVKKEPEDEKSAL